MWFLSLFIIIECRICLSRLNSNPLFDNITFSGILTGEFSMLIVISPAKTLDYQTPAKTKVTTLPDYLDDSQELINRLRRFSSLDIAELMKVSKKIADLNFDRYENWKKKFTDKNAKQNGFRQRGRVGPDRFRPARERIDTQCLI